MFEDTFEDRYTDGLMIKFTTISFRGILSLCTFRVKWEIKSTIKDMNNGRIRWKPVMKVTRKGKNDE